VDLATSTFERLKLTSVSYLTRACKLVVAALAVARVTRAKVADLDMLLKTLLRFVC
jgi:hypothetical protein